MTNFLYKATDRRGRWVSGEIQATDHTHASALLTEANLTVESLTQADPHPTSPEVAGGRQDLVELIENLATLTKTGLPLPSGLRAASDEADSPVLRSTFRDLADAIEAGGNLEDALLATRRSFPPRLRGLILAGARSGRMPELLSEFVRFANLGTELRGIFWRALAYPTFALVLVLVLAGFVGGMTAKAVESLASGMPVFSNLSSERGILAASIDLSRFLNLYLWQGVMAAIVVIVVAWVWVQFLLSPAQRSRWLASLPVVGAIYRFSGLAEFCQLLALFVEANLPLPKAFELAGASSEAAEVADATSLMARAVDAGASLSDAVLVWKSIPAGLGQLFRWSEERGHLPQALRLAGDMFTSRARSQASHAANMMAIGLVIFNLWWVGVTITLLYLPMMVMIRLMQF